MGTIAANLAVIRERMNAACTRSGRDPREVRLVAVTKTVGVPLIREAIEAGVTILGENRVQEAISKYAPLPDSAQDHPDLVGRAGIELHMIGHLQRNKARPAAGFFDAVQSLDRAELADALENALDESGRLLPVLLEVNVSGEPTKSGVSPAELEGLAAHVSSCHHLRGAGLMTIARLGAPESELRQTFSTLRSLRDRIRDRYGSGWSELSMGMSDDYEIAIEEGATLVRLGRAIFGERSS